MRWTTIKEHTHTMPDGARVRVVVDSCPDEGVGFSDACPEMALEAISDDEYHRIDAWDPDIHTAAETAYQVLRAAGVDWNGVETVHFTLTPDGRYQRTTVPYHEYGIGETFHEGDTLTWQEYGGQWYIIHGGEDSPAMVRYAIRVLEGDVAFHTIRARVWRTDAAEPWNVSGMASLGMVETEAIREHIPGIAHEALHEAGIDSDTTLTIIAEIM